MSDVDDWRWSMCTSGSSAGSTSASGSSASGSCGTSGIRCDGLGDLDSDELDGLLAVGAEVVGCCGGEISSSMIPVSAAIVLVLLVPDGGVLHAVGGR